MNRYPPIAGIGVHLYSMREEAGATRPEIAEKMGVSPGTIKKWENEVNALSFSAFLGFCKACELDPVNELRLYLEVSPLD